MNPINVEEFRRRLIEHDMWLNNPATGSRFELNNATIVEQDLRSLRDYKFRKAKFVNVRFNKINAFDVRFVRCEFSNTKFSQSNLDKADFDESQLSHVTFDNCSCKEISFSSTEGSNIYLSGDFERAYFGKALWKDVTAERLSCPGSRLRKMTLDNANLVGIDLRDAQLTGVMLTDVDMREALLQGTDWLRTHLERVRLGGAQGRAGSGIELAWGDAIDFSPNGDGSQLGGTDELRRALESGVFDASVLR